MNIKEHIEAGHYATDDKGRALVPMRAGNGRTATIYAIDCPARGQPIVGWDGASIEAWNLEGHFHSSGGGYSPLDLLPPPPRKVKVTGRVFVDRDTGCIRAIAEPHNDPRDFPNWRVVELADFPGEYEEPWS